MELGYVKIYRQLKDKGYYKKSEYVHLWVHLLLSVNHSQKEFMWNGKIILIKEGQVITGRKELSKQTGIKQGTIENILEMLENEHQIQQQKTTKYRLITIVNWKEFQKGDSTSDNRVTTEWQQSDTNKNDKNDKNDTSLGKERVFNSETLQKFIETWNSYKTGTGRNQTVYTKLLPQCIKVNPEMEQKWEKLNKFLNSYEDATYAIQKYVVEIQNRDPKNDYCRHRFSCLEFIGRENGLRKFANR